MINVHSIVFTFVVVVCNFVGMNNYLRSIRKYRCPFICYDAALHSIALWDYVTRLPQNCFVRA